MSRSQTAGGATTWYNYDIGSNILNEENGSGTLARSYYGGGYSDGSNPSTGTWRFYTQDHLGSTRGLYDTGKASQGSYEYEPYGSLYAYSGPALQTIGASFTGKPFEHTSGLYWFPYRMYDSGLCSTSTVLSP